MHQLISRLIIALAALTALTACGDSDSFTIKGTVTDGSTMGLRFSFYDGTAMQSGLAAAHEGRFSYRGVSRQPVVVEVTDNDYRLLARCVAANGDVISIDIDPAEPARSHTDGNDLTRRWGKWLNDNADVLATADVRSVNELVGLYVKAHTDDPLSGLLMVTQYDAAYDPAGADRLMSALSPAARPSGLAEGYSLLLESVTGAEATGRVASINYFNRSGRLDYFNPSRASYSLLVVDNSHSGRRDSITPALARLSTLGSPRRLNITELSVDPDTATWHRDHRNDSTAWATGWAAGSIGARGVSRLGVSRLPFFVVTDSTGERLYSGCSLTKAENLVNKLLR